MRVLYFSRDYTPHDLRFLQSIIENGDEVWYLRLEAKNVIESRPLPEAVHFVDWQFGKGPFDLERDEDQAIQALQNIFDTVRPDVIHSGPLTDCAYLTAKAGLHPHAAMSWGFDLGREIDTIPGAKERTAFALANSDWLIGDCRTELSKAAELGYPPERATVFPWGIDPRRFTPGAASLREELGSQEDFLILSLRSMEPIYDVETIVRAFLKASRTAPDMKLVLLGDGSQMPMLKEIAANDENGGKILFRGRMRNEMLVEYYRSCDLYVSASLVDGSSVSLLEAMGCGLPVLVSDNTGNLEWVQNGENGLLFRIGDADGLAEKMIMCRQHPELLRTCAETARKLIEEKADWDKNNKMIHTAYVRAIEQ